MAANAITRHRCKSFQHIIAKIYIMVQESAFEMFPCDFCSASFSRKHDLERHRRGHSGEGEFFEACVEIFS
jgi:uncharacterized Zn-finger protein